MGCRTTFVELRLSNRVCRTTRAINYRAGSHPEDDSGNSAGFGSDFSRLGGRRRRFASSEGDGGSRSETVLRRSNGQPGPSSNEATRFDDSSGAGRLWSDAHLRRTSEMSKDSTAVAEAQTEKAGKLRAEADLDMLKILVDSVREYAIIMLDPTGQIMSWSPAAERLKGYSAEEIIGKNISIFCTAED